MKVGFSFGKCVLLFALIMFLAGQLCRSARISAAEARQLHLRVMLEGLYDPAAHAMRPAMELGPDGPAPVYGDDVAGQVTVSLHEDADYTVHAWGDLLVREALVMLSLDGQATVNLPGSKDDGLPDGPYWVSVRHHNHLEVVFKTPVNIDGDGPFVVDLMTGDAHGQNGAMGDNQQLLGDMAPDGSPAFVYGMFAGDISGDGAVGLIDRSMMNAALRKGARGNVPEDLNGDGLTTIADRSLLMKNFRALIHAIHPASTKSQRPPETRTNTRGSESCVLILDAFEQVSENEVQFDVILHNTGPAFYLNDLQVDIRFNPAILGESEIVPQKSLKIIPESSELMYEPLDRNFIYDDLSGIIVLYSEEPYEQELAQRIENDAQLRIARIKISPYYDGKRGVFKSTYPHFSLGETYTTVITCMTDENGHKLEVSTPVSNISLLNNILTRPLASFYFMGTGGWTDQLGEDYILWNRHPETHPNYAFRKPGINDNVIIAGKAIIENLHVQLDIDELEYGGTIILLNGRDFLYRIEILSNNENAIVALYDNSFQEMDNPALIDAGEVVLFASASTDEAGDFINWTDQHGNIISDQTEFGPYIMPAEDMQITANWTSGSVLAAGAGVPGSAGGLNSAKDIAACHPHGVTQEERAGWSTTRSDPEASLIIRPGASLTVHSLYNDNAADAEAIILESNQEGDVPGSLIHHNNGVKATVQRYVRRHNGDSPARGWHMISSPAQGMAIRPEFVPGPKNGVIPSYVDFYQWDEALTKPDAQGEMVSGWWVNSRNEGGLWNDSFEHAFATGKGYLLAYAEPATKADTGHAGLDSNMAKAGKLGDVPPANFITKADDEPGTYGNRAHRLQGFLETEDVIVTGLTYTEGGQYAGWHLLGNPFASAISWNQGEWQRVNILGGPKVWHEAYASYTPVLDIIPAMNGFMVHTSGNGSLTIPAAARVHDTQGWYKTDHAAQGVSTDGHNVHQAKTGGDGVPPYVRLIARDPGGDTAQETLIVFRPEASGCHDPHYDTPFMPGYAPAFFSLSEGKALALNNQRSGPGNLVVTLGFEKNASDSFSIAITGNTAEAELFLEDMVQCHVHALGKGAEYHFTARDDDPVERFRLHVNPTQPIESSCLEQDTTILAWTHEGDVHVYTPDGATHLALLDVQGRMLREYKLFGEGRHQVTPGLPAGLYILRIAAPDVSLSKKVFLTP